MGMTLGFFWITYSCRTEKQSNSSDQQSNSRGNTEEINVWNSWIAAVFRVTLITFLGCALVLLKFGTGHHFSYSILRAVYCFPCVYLSKYRLSLEISDLILEMSYF